MTRAVSAALSISLLLSLCACAPKPSVDPAEAVSRFQQQNSVSCTVESELVLNRSDTDDTEGVFTEALDAEGAVNMESRDCHLSGVLTHSFDSGERILSDVESYGGAFGAYYRLDDSYYTSEEENTYLSLMLAPLALHLEGYTASDVTELFYGSECTVFTGTEIADDSAPRLICGIAAGGSVSLDGCLVDIQLCINNATSLPACVRLSYTNLEEMDVSFTGEDGTVYKPTALTYTITYQGYGTEVSTDVPEEFRQMAERSTGSEPASAVMEQDGSYLLCAADGSAVYKIGVPEYMTPEKADSQNVSFTYYYSETDLERIKYQLLEKRAESEMIAYAQSLAGQFKETDGVSDVSDDGIRSTTINDTLVKYIAVSFDYTQDGECYQVVNITSWTKAPDAQGFLLVEISEYNADTDAEMIDAKDELDYAYRTVNEYTEKE